MIYKVDMSHEFVINGDLLKFKKHRKLNEY